MGIFEFWLLALLHKGLGYTDTQSSVGFGFFEKVDNGTRVHFILLQKGEVSLHQPRYFGEGSGLNGDDRREEDRSPETSGLRAEPIPEVSGVMPKTTN